MKVSKRYIEITSRSVFLTQLSSPIVPLSPTKRFKRVQTSIPSPVPERNVGRRPKFVGYSRYIGSRKYVDSAFILLEEKRRSSV